MNKLLLTLIIFISSVFADKYDNIANGFIEYSKQEKTISKKEKIKDMDNNVVGYIYHLEENGYIIVSINPNSTPIKAYSFKTEYDRLPDSYKRFLIGDLTGKYKALGGKDGTVPATMVFRNKFGDSNTIQDTIKNDKISKNIGKWKLLESKNTKKGDIEAVEPSIKNNPPIKTKTVYIKKESNEKFQMKEVPFVYEAVSQLVDATWNQTLPYNSLFPIKNSDNALTGCVQTATGQVMKYYSHPSQGTGFHMYNAQVNSSGTYPLKRFFATTYNWDNMPLALDGSSNDTEITDVASLMLDLAVANTANLGTNETGASSLSPASTLPNYFKYSTDINTLSNDDNSFYDVVKSNIDSNQVMILSIPGHMTVLDGYIDNELGQQIHMNLGWGGYANDYYFIDQTIQAGGTNFAPSLDIIYNIKPCSGADCTEQLDQYDGYNYDNQKITGKYDFKFDIDTYVVYLKGATTITFGDSSTDNAPGFMALYDVNGDILAETTSSTQPISQNLPVGKYYLKTSMTRLDNKTTYINHYDTYKTYGLSISTTALTDGEKTDVGYEDDPNPNPEVPEDEDPFTYTGDLIVGNEITFEIDQTYLNGYEIKEYSFNNGNGVFTEVEPANKKFTHSFLTDGSATVTIKLENTKKAIASYSLTLDIAPLSTDQLSDLKDIETTYCEKNPTMCLDSTIDNVTEDASNFGLTTLGKDILVKLAAKDYAGAKSLYANYASVTFPSKKGVSPLHVAIKKKELSTITSLIANGADINKQDDKKGMTPLHYAIDKDLTEVIVQLLDAGADASLENEKGMNVLFYSIEKAKGESFKTLIENGVDASMRDSSGKTFMYYAVFKKKLKKMIEDFKISGVDLSIKDSNGASLVHYLSQINDIKFLELLSIDPDVTIDFTEVDNDNQNAINYSYFYKSPKTNTRAYLESKGITINDFSNNRTLLHVYAEYKNSKGLIAAVEGNLSGVIDSKDASGKTAAHYLAEKGEGKTLIALSEIGANLELQDNNGNTPILSAVGSIDGKKALKSLFELNVNITPLNNNGQNIMHIASGATIVNINSLDKKALKSELKKAAVIKSLFKLNESSAQTLAAQKDDFNITPLLYGIQCDNTKAVGDLVKNGVDVSSSGDNADALQYAYIYSKDYKTIKILQKAGVSNFQTTGDDWYWTRSTKFDKAFLKEDMDYNTIDTSGNLAIHYAASLGKKGVSTVTKLVTKYNANINQKNFQNGKTAMHYFAETTDEKTLTKLVDKLSPDLTIEDNSGRTSAYYAFLHSNQTGFEYLLNYYINN